MDGRGRSAIVGVGWHRAQRDHPGRTSDGLIAEAAAWAIADAGLTPREIDGLIAEEPDHTADYLGIKPTFASGVQMHGATGAAAVAMASAYIGAGYATTVLIAFGGLRGADARAGATTRNEWADPYGPVVAANGWYALVAQRHAFEYGTTDEQRFKVAVDQRSNALGHPGATFRDQPMTAEDVRSSRLVADPLRLLECVMPVGGAGALVVTSAERARSLRHRPVYLLGAGLHVDHEEITWADRPTRSPAWVSARRAFQMAGLKPADMDMAQIYDCYTITVMVTLEDAGFVPQGESGPWYLEHDTTYRGAFPINTHGGQLSYGQQPQHAGGLSQVLEAVLQLQGRAGGRQARRATTCFVNG